MKVYLFGAVSSPSCSNYALRKAADDSETTVSAETADVQGNIPSLTTAFVQKKRKNQPLNEYKVFAKHVLKEALIRPSSSVTVWPCWKAYQKKRVLKRLERWNQVIFTLVERALGVEQPIESDTFGFRIIIHDQPLTQRRTLSTISSFYDPLGIAVPFLLGGKKKISVEQSLVEIGEEFRLSWDNWRSQLPALEHSSMMRSLKPTTFGKVISRQIHSFSDASLTGYGQETYPRITNEKGDIHCAFLMGKVRVAPVKTTTTPRLELTTAAVSV